MPRERRIEYAGGIYHAMARGNRRGDIVLDDRDRERFAFRPRSICRNLPENQVNHS